MSGAKVRSTPTCTLNERKPDPWKRLFRPCDSVVCQINLIEALEERLALTAGPIGPVIGVNAVNATAQRSSDIATDQNGRYVTVWKSLNQDGSANGIYARLFGADGAALTDEFIVNQTTQGDQNLPAVAMSAGGDFVVAWESAPQNGVIARRYTAAGAPKGNEFLALDRCNNAGVSCDAAGDFVVTGTANNGGASGSDAYAQRFNTSGASVGTSFLIEASTAGDQLQPSSAMDDAGNIAFTWVSNSSIYIRRFSSLGVALSGDVQISNSQTSDVSPHPSVAMDGLGNSLIAWGNGQDISAQRFDASGALLGGNFVVNSETNGTQIRPSVSMNHGGVSVVTWADGINAFGQVFGPAGERLGNTFKIFPQGSGVYDANAVAIRNDGNFMVTFEGQDDKNVTDIGVFARQFTQYSDPASLGGMVWKDTNGDGIRSQTESGTNGLTVQLFSPDEGLIDVATTAGGGIYRFDNLQPGHPYYLQFSTTGNLVFTATFQGNNGALDSEADPLTGQTGILVFDPDEIDLSHDAGLASPATVSGTLFDDRNNDGVQQAGEGV